MAVYGYIRLDTGNAFSVQPADQSAQAGRIAAAAAINGSPVDGFFTDSDDGLTAFADRQAGAELLSAIQPGDIVVLSSVDRISQHETTLFDAIETLFAKKVKVIAPDVHAIPLEKGAMPTFRLQMMGMIHTMFRSDDFMASLDRRERALRDRIAELERIAVCPECGGSLPDGHSHNCRYWRETAP